MILALSLGAQRVLLGGALGLLGAQIVVLDALAARSPVVLVLCAAALLTLGELASLSVGLRAVELVDRAVVRRRCAYLGAVAAGAGAAAGLVELASRIAIRGGLLAGAIGVGATVALLALVALLARGHAGGG